VLADDYRTAPAEVRLEETFGRGAWLRIILREGRKRQIRETGSLIGLPVVKIIRVRMGSLYLIGLKPGEWRHLTPDEILDLKRPPAPVGRTLRRDPPRRAPSNSPDDEARPADSRRRGSPHAETVRRSTRSGAPRSEASRSNAPRSNAPRSNAPGDARSVERGPAGANRTPGGGRRSPSQGRGPGGSSSRSRPSGRTDSDQSQSHTTSGRRPTTGRPTTGKPGGGRPGSSNRPARSRPAGPRPAGRKKPSSK
jgi:23S rRNA pseudouridine2605 synthase